MKILNLGGIIATKIIVTSPTLQNINEGENKTSNNITKKHIQENNNASDVKNINKSIECPIIVINQNDNNEIIKEGDSKNYSVNNGHIGNNIINNDKNVIDKLAQTESKCGECRPNKDDPSNLKNIEMLYRNFTSNSLINSILFQNDCQQNGGKNDIKDDIAFTAKGTLNCINETTCTIEKVIDESTNGFSEVKENSTNCTIKEADESTNDMMESVGDINSGIGTVRDMNDIRTVGDSNPSCVAVVSTNGRLQYKLFNG